MTVLYFGERWRVPPNTSQDMAQVATPVGEPCNWCRETIVAGDQGVMVLHTALRRPYWLWDLLSAVAQRPSARYKAAQLPLHRECNLRMLVGSVAHLSGRCICCGETNETPYPGTRREEAQAVQEMIEYRGE